jgi:pimeloyl-ACP methyl ester carboxylesterase
VSVGEWQREVADGDGGEAVRLDSQLRDFDWAVLPEGAVRETFRAPSGALAMFSLGDPRNPRVVLVPGATGSKEDFTLLAPLLAAGGFYVQSFDLAGQFESADAGPGSRGRYDYPLFVRDLTAFLESGPAAHLLGYSFAGIVAQIVAVDRPELCLSLTLLTTPPDTGQSFRSVRVVGRLSWFTTARVAAGLMIWGIVTNKNKVLPRRLEFVRSRFSLTRRSSVNDIMRLMKHAPDLRSSVRSLPIPKLAAVGNHDLWPTARHARYAEAIGARLAVYQTGHSPCETAPHQLARDMLQLFRDAH